MINASFFPSRYFLYCWMFVLSLRRWFSYLRASYLSLYFTITSLDVYRYAYYESSLSMVNWHPFSFAILSHIYKLGFIAFAHHYLQCLGWFPFLLLLRCISSQGVILVINNHGFFLRVVFTGDIPYS